MLRRFADGDSNSNKLFLASEMLNLSSAFLCDEPALQCSSTNRQRPCIGCTLKNLACMNLCSSLEIAVLLLVVMAHLMVIPK